MERRPSIILGMNDHFRPFWVEVIIEHDLEMVRLGFNSWGFKSVHDHLTFSMSILVIDPGKEGIDGSEKVGEEVFVFAVPSQMGMGGHEAIRIDLNPVAIFVFQKEVIIELFGPIGF